MLVRGATTKTLPPVRQADNLVPHAIAGGISLDPQPRTELHDAPIPTSASRSSQLHFSHPRMLAHLPVLRQTTRLGGTIDEQIAEDSIERLGEPGKRVSQGMGLGLARVYAEVSSLE